MYSRCSKHLKDVCLCYLKKKENINSFSQIFLLPMFRPLSTLNLPSTIVTELNKKGFIFVEDVLNNSECLKKLNLNKSALEKQLKVSEFSALDVWQNEIQRGSISICCSELEAILGDGFQCGVITELSGPPYSGKTQICMQLCIAVQLNKCHGGLNGRAIYIDTRSGITIMRLRDMIKGYKNYYKNLNLQEDEVFKNIELFTPMSIEELELAIEKLKTEVKTVKNNKQVRLIIIDSLSMPILCCIDEPLKRPYYYSKFLHELHKLALKYELSVIVTNEFVTQIDSRGKFYYAAAGGQYVSDYAFIKLELTRLSNNKFATRLVKSSIRPEVSVTFEITEDGIRNNTQV